MKSLAETGMMEAMPRKPVARDAVLDAFEDLLIEVGERAATLDAVAERAGVSKGGLLYHFPNKEALIAVMLERLDELRRRMLAAMAAAPEGAAAYFIRTSLWSDTPMDRVIRGRHAAGGGGPRGGPAPVRRTSSSSGWTEIAADVGPGHGQGRAVHGGRAVLQRHAGGRAGRDAGGGGGRRREPAGRGGAAARLSATAGAVRVLAASPARPRQFADSLAA